MVRRGSTVRVRQRALQKPRSRGFFVQIHLHSLHCGQGMELFMELSGFGERESGGGSAATGDRDGRIRAALRAYENSAWGRAVADRDQAAGLCKRASLVLLELLNREGIDDAELWHLGMPKEGSGFAPGDEHYVVVIGAEAIDATARRNQRPHHAPIAQGGREAVVRLSARPDRSRRPVDR
jgi:hypothetical protein